MLIESATLASHETSMACRRARARESERERGRRGGERNDWWSRELKDKSPNPLVFPWKRSTGTLNGGCVSATKRTCGEVVVVLLTASALPFNDLKSVKDRGR